LRSIIVTRLTMGVVRQNSCRPNSCRRRETDVRELRRGYNHDPDLAQSVLVLELPGPECGELSARLERYGKFEFSDPWLGLEAALALANSPAVSQPARDQWSRTAAWGPALAIDAAIFRNNGEEDHIARKQKSEINHVVSVELRYPRLSVVTSPPVLRTRILAIPEPLGPRGGDTGRCYQGTDATTVT
jgi:hypothetical protein